MRDGHRSLGNALDLKGDYSSQLLQPSHYKEEECSYDEHLVIKVREEAT